jgi:hypothetical protein
MAALSSWVPSESPEESRVAGIPPAAGAVEGPHLAALWVPGEDPTHQDARPRLLIGDTESLFLTDYGEPMSPVAFRFRVYPSLALPSLAPGVAPSLCLAPVAHALSLARRACQ